jgi:plasmid stability protein
MATLTLHDIPDELLSRLEQRAHSHGRSLNSEVVDCLTRLVPAEGLATTPPSPFDRDAALARIREIQARFPGAANAAQQDTRTQEEIEAQLAHFAELRSHFKGPPLTSEEIIAAIDRDSHPPELDRFGNRITPQS